MTSNRRTFGKVLGAGALGSLIPGSVMGANEKVNVAFIGIGGMGGGDAKAVARVKDVNVVALCDIAMGTSHTAGIEKQYPNVPRFRDFREMFDKMGDEIDACTVAVPDHSHFPIAMTAMSLGIGVYVEKPLAHTFHECELMMEAERNHKVAAQMGNQGHSGANYFQFKLWQDAGIIKDIHRVDAYMNKGRRWHPWQFDEYQTGEEMPSEIDWDVWNGTREMRPYSNKFHPGNWRSWFEYGNGAFGDWGPHTLDTVHRFLKLGYPTKVKAEKLEGRRKLIYPMASTILFDFPERGEGLPACEVRWYDGTKNLPPRPEQLEEKYKVEACGKVLYGKDLTFKGTTHSSPLAVIPFSQMSEMRDQLPKVTGKNSNHHENWILSVKGEETCRSTFQVSGELSQVFSLGVIAQRLGGEFNFDPVKKQIVGNEAANQLLMGPPPRKGWEQFYKMA